MLAGLSKKVNQEDLMCPSAGIPQKNFPKATGLSESIFVRRWPSGADPDSGFSKQAESRCLWFRH